MNWNKSILNSILHSTLDLATTFWARILVLEIVFVKVQRGSPVLDAKLVELAVVWAVDLSHFMTVRAVRIFSCTLSEVVVAAEANIIMALLLHQFLKSHDRTWTHHTTHSLHIVFNIEIRWRTISRSSIPS